MKKPAKHKSGGEEWAWLGWNEDQFNECALNYCLALNHMIILAQRLARTAHATTAIDTNQEALKTIPDEWPETLKRLAESIPWVVYVKCSEQGLEQFPSELGRMLWKSYLIQRGKYLGD